MRINITRRLGGQYSSTDVIELLEKQQFSVNSRTSLHTFLVREYPNSSTEPNVIAVRVDNTDQISTLCYGHDFKKRKDARDKIIAILKGLN